MCIPHKIYPGHAFHAHVRQQQVRALVFQRLDRGFRALHAHGLAAHHFQAKHQRPHDPRIVVRHQNSQHVGLLMRMNWGRGEETFLEKGFLSPPPSPRLSPSQDFPMRASACSLMRERADRTLFVTAKRLSAQTGNTGFRRRLGVAQGDCRKTGPPSNAFHSLLPVGLLSFHKTGPPRQTLPLNRNSISAKVFGKGGMFLRK